jgi:hypothetical protein|tara:strand:+ start:2227 stop:2418 length:192 start_codon:yes stop_codon:yes gene_type:complete
MGEIIYDESLDQLLRIYRRQFGDIPTLIGSGLTTQQLRDKLDKAFLTFTPMDIDNDVPKNAVI